MLCARVARAGSVLRVTHLNAAQCCCPSWHGAAAGTACSRGPPPSPPVLPPQARIVPLIVEYDAFWTRYFYRLHRLEQKHAQFQQLTQRTLAAQAEEEEVRPRAALCSAATVACPHVKAWRVRDSRLLCLLAVHATSVIQLPHAPL